MVEEVDFARLYTLSLQLGLRGDNETFTASGGQRRQYTSNNLDAVRPFGWEASLKLKPDNNNNEKLNELIRASYLGFKSVEIVPTESQTIPLNFLGAYSFINVNFPNKYATLTFYNNIQYPLFEMFNNLNFLPLTQDINNGPESLTPRPPQTKFDFQLTLKKANNDFHSLIYLAGCEVRSVSLDPFDYSITNKMHEFKLGVIYQRLISSSDVTLKDRLGFGGILEPTNPQTDQTTPTDQPPSNGYKSIRL